MRRLAASLSLLVLAVGLLVDAPSFADAEAAYTGPSGPELTFASRPIHAHGLRACSFRVPLCVHAGDPRDGAAARDALAAFETAWLTLTQALALPAPDPDPDTLAYDVFVADGVFEDGAPSVTRFEARDVRSRVDRGRAFTLVDRRLRTGCRLDAAAATALARASLYRVAPATEPGTARAQAAYLATLAVPCSLALTADAVSTFQAHADRTFCDAHVDDGRKGAAFAEGAATFWSRLDWAYGRTPGGIVTASWALHPTMTPLGAARWKNEPDTFDVLRATFKGALSTRGTVDDLWLDFAVARAFLGDADDGFHQPELATLGPAARVPLTWDVAWPKTPRRFAARTPVSPTGASYLLIHRAGAAKGTRLRAEIEWEEHALFRWAFVKLDATGHELGRVVIPTTERATQAQMTLVDLDGVDRVLLVGTNLGDPAYAFDPDEEAWEPHGWLVTIAED